MKTCARAYHSYRTKTPERRKMAHTCQRPRCSRAILHYTAQAHPPAAAGQPFPAFWQHHAFLATDHPAIQFANPALQSYGAEVVPTGAHPPACCPGQPFPCTLQHHSFFGTLHPACQFANPSAQLYGSAGAGGIVGITGGKIGCTGGKTGCTGGRGGNGRGGGAVGGHPRWWTLQHHAFLSAAHVFSASTAQLNGSTGPTGTGCVGGNVCGGVGGGVGNGVGGTVIGGSGRAVAGRVVVHPLPMVLQQKSCCAWDHAVSHIGKPSSQSYGSVVPTPDNNQRSNGSNSSKLNKQQLVMMQVKSLLGRTTSKSPPAPTYLYVVSCMYSPPP